MNDEGLFSIVGTVRYAPKGIGLKIESVETNKGKTYKTTHEVICFDKTLLNGLEAGARIRVTGHLGSRKTEFMRDGKYPVYMTQLIARAIVPADGARHTTQPASSHLDDVPPPTDDDVPF